MPNNVRIYISNRYIVINIKYFEYGREEVLKIYTPVSRRFLKFL